jgi:putative protein kinase ArgK-like GTPase of G3E family
LLEATWQRLVTCFQCHVYVTGAAGVGKTTFAETLIRRLIDADQIVRDIWLDAPPSCEYAGIALPMRCW